MAGRNFIDRGIDAYERFLKQYPRLYQPLSLRNGFFVPQGSLFGLWTARILIAIGLIGVAIEFAKLRG